MLKRRPLRRDRARRRCGALHLCRHASATGGKSMATKNRTFATAPRTDEEAATRAPHHGQQQPCRPWETNQTSALQEDHRRLRQSERLSQRITQRAHGGDLPICRGCCRCHLLPSSKRWGCLHCCARDRNRSPPAARRSLCAPEQQQPPSTQNPFQ